MKPRTLNWLSKTLHQNPLLPEMPTLPRWASLPGIITWPQPKAAPVEAPPEPPPAAHRIAGFPRLDYTIHPAQGASDRLLVLLRGINTAAQSSTEQAEHWAYLVDGIRDLYGGIAYFSYNAASAEQYAVADTHKGIWDHHRKLLYNLLASAYDQGYRRFDLIGHSLGGVVATEYLVYYGQTGAQRDWVRHVITLDSPVNGSSRVADRNFAYRDQFADMGIQAALDIADMYMNRTHYEKVKTRILDDLRAQGIAYWNLSSVDDWVVPVEDAILANSYRTYHLGRARRSLEPSQNRGHAQIFQSATVRHDIRRIVEQGALAPGESVTSAVRLPAPPLPAPARKAISYANNSVRRATNTQLTRLAMLMMVMHYTREEEPEAATRLGTARAALAEQAMDGLQRAAYQARMLREQAPTLPAPREALTGSLHRLQAQLLHLREEAFSEIEEGAPPEDAGQE